MPPSQKNVTLSQLRVGIFVLIAIAVLVFLVLNASGDINPFSRKLHLKARFADANGLREGSEVRLAGVRVGKVERIVLLEPSTDTTAPRVEAQMVIDANIDGKPASDRIRTEFASTARFAEPAGKRDAHQHHAGSSMGQPIADGAVLPLRRRIPVNDFATSGTELAQRLSKLSDEIQLIVKDVRDGKGTVGRLFSDEALYNNLNATIRETEDVMRQVRSGRRFGR
jgi:phospholipid/cholesterol/gamma-HCH transport system substrate-binding protein